MLIQSHPKENPSISEYNEKIEWMISASKGRGGLIWVYKSLSLKNYLAERRVREDCKSAGWRKLVQ